MKKATLLCLFLILALLLSSCSLIRPTDKRPVFTEDSSERTSRRDRDSKDEEDKDEDEDDEEEDKEDEAEESSRSSSEPKPEGSDTTEEAAFRICMITDYGTIDDHAYNEAVYQGCLSFSRSKDIDLTYIRPGSDSDLDRVIAIKQAISSGYNILVLPGYSFGKALAETAGQYPDVYFIAIDLSAGDVPEGYTLPSNVVCCTYQEELAGYLAGFAAVSLGYTRLGFLGGMAVPAVVRYGYGFLQGVDDAAKGLAPDSVEVKYGYANQFYGDEYVTAVMKNWYSDGTQIIFACGGGLYTSVAEAAKEYGGKLIGTDIDLSVITDEIYGPGLTVTSAVKDFAMTAFYMLSSIVDGKFSEHGGKYENLGMDSLLPSENFVKLASSTQFSDSFTETDYYDLVGEMYLGIVSGVFSCAPDISKSPGEYGIVINVIDLGTIH